MKKSFIEYLGSWMPALLVGVGLALAGIFVGNGVRSISANSRVVTVRGLCEREVKANQGDMADRQQICRQ